MITLRDFPSHSYNSPMNIERLRGREVDEVTNVDAEILSRRRGIEMM